MKITTDLQNTYNPDNIELTLFPTIVLIKNNQYRLSFEWMIWKFSVTYDEPKKD